MSENISTIVEWIYRSVLVIFALFIVTAIATSYMESMSEGMEMSMADYKEYAVSVAVVNSGENVVSLDSESDFETIELDSGQKDILDLDKDYGCADEDIIEGELFLMGTTAVEECDWAPITHPDLGDQPVFFFLDTSKPAGERIQLLRGEQFEG